jgi:tetratricopeptide (TPR) repeat protein
MLTTWTREHPDDVNGFTQLGRVLADLGRYPESGRAYERALALGDRSPWSAAGLGLVRAGERKHEEAVELLGRAVAGGVQDGRVLAQLGLSQLMTGRTEEGVRSYEQALAAGLPAGANGRGIAAFNLACGYARLGRADDAFAQLEVAVTERFATRRALEGDADLAPLRGDARFGQLLAKLPSR